MIGNEAERIERAKGGSEEAFESLLSESLARLLGVARRMLRDDDEAWDVAQEAALKAWQGLTFFRGECRFSTWICGIAVRLALDRIRDRRVVEEAGEEPAGADSPSLAVESKILGETIERAVRGLPEGEREVFVMHEGAGMKYREIAAQLRVPIGTVMSRLSSARLKLRQVLEPWWKE